MSSLFTRTLKIMFSLSFVGESISASGFGPGDPNLGGPNPLGTPAPHNWLNAKEVKVFFLLGFPGAPLRTQLTSCIRLRENKKRQLEKVLYSQISFTIYDRFYISCLKLIIRQVESSVGNVNAI